MASPLNHSVPNASGSGQPQGPAPAHPSPYSEAQGSMPLFAAPSRTNVLAIISLISAFMFSAAAVVTGHIALSEIKRTREAGRGMALAGLIIGYVGVAFTIVFIIVYLALISTIFAHMPSTGTAYRN